ncbi:MAG: hypothetical protein LBV01_00560, partial [Deltaproteobacteria bacterium]|nr:hypothetical protein [Deltaproteobacteria bacterium]
MPVACAHFCARFRAHIRSGLAVLSCAAALLALFPEPAPAARKVPAAAFASGALPRSGRVVLRSGLEWLDEAAPVFQKFAADFGRELTARGLSLVAVKPSALSAMPETPMPRRNSEAGGVDAPKARPNPARVSGVNDAEAALKASELGHAGRLPKLALRGYSAPSQDADLPETVKAVSSPDVTRALFALSQQRGNPAVNSFAIPGRLPAEIKGDAGIADYAVIVRFASVRLWAGREDKPFPGPPGVLVAALGVGGSGSLGFGPPASPSARGNGAYGTQGGYMRGYEGSAPND